MKNTLTTEQFEYWKVLFAAAIAGLAGFNSVSELMVLATKIADESVRVATEKGKDNGIYP